MNIQLMLGCKLHKKNSLEKKKKNSLKTCLRIDLFFYIMMNSFYNKDAYHNTLLLLWYDHSYSVTVTGLRVPPNSEFQKAQEYKDEEQVLVLRCGEDGIEARTRRQDQSTWVTVTWSLASSCSHRYFGLGCTV